MGFGAGLNKHQDFPSSCLNKKNTPTITFIKKHYKETWILLFSKNLFAINPPASHSDSVPK